MGASVIAALVDVLQFQNVLATFIGVLFGLFIGSTPGLTISLGMVLLLPITFKLEAVTSICLLLGLYASGMTGGSLSAILLNIPGTPSASATAIDGHAMAKKGRAGEALGVAPVWCWRRRLLPGWPFVSERRSFLRLCCWG
jgi:putative tricarboxylic transport membrane protein